MESGEESGEEPGEEPGVESGEEPGVESGENQVENQVENQNLTFISQYLGISENAGWMSFYDYFKRIGIVKNEYFERYVEFLKKGIWSITFHPKYVFICRLPKTVLRNERGQLSSLVEPATQWKDGMDNYFIDGVGFDEELWIKIVRKKLTPKEAIELKNIEQRMIALKEIGYDKIVKKLGGKIVESKFVKSGREYQLIEINLQDDANPARFVKVVCPSTGKEALLRVPPATATIQEGLAWGFGLDAEKYQPLIET